MQINSKKKLKMFNKLLFKFIRKNSLFNDYALKLNSRKNLLFFTKLFNSYDTYDKYNFNLKNSVQIQTMQFHRKNIYETLLQLYYSKLCFFILYRRNFFFFKDIYRYTFSLFFLLKKNTIIFYL